MKIFEKAAELERKNRGFVIISIVKASGSVPGKAGFKMLVETGGKTTGTVGGGAIEKRAIEEALSRLGNNQTGLQEYILQEKPEPVTHKGEAEIVPMMCNGKVWIYYDVMQNSTPVYVFGGGHVGQALSYFLAGLDYQVTLIDNRPEFANEQVNPYVDELITEDYTHFAERFSPPTNGFVVIVTHSHDYDYGILKTIYHRKLPLKYIGVIASKSKSRQLIENLKTEPGIDSDLSNLYSSIGLDLGGSTEKEIALSIAAEIQAVRYGKKAPHLRTAAGD
jgi:xanthine dehydrogenase accessory factor